ncbi:hypothetical protein GGR53DRAFT_526822 [Hypoxylon sp. FL1150]|nr:hypothetical protein GGR53DRAFT_526822 [Hypoxylon sp. FL1150]
MASPDQPAVTVLGRPRPPPPVNAGVTTTISADPPPRAGDRTSQFEFRGFDFFANRDFNELRNASRAYFAPGAAEKHQRLPSTWLGDATPPGTPRQSDAVGPVGGDFFQSPPERQTLRDDKRIFGLRRAKFWWLLGLLALLLLVAIAVGVGVGVGKAASESSKAAVDVGSISSSSTVVPVETSTVITTTTTSSPSKTTTSSATTSTTSSEGKIDCPAVNGTIYQVPGSNKSFLRICGIDYSGDEAVDLRQVYTDNPLDCMTNCAGTADCTGCGWGYLDGDTGTQHRCWLKGSLKQSHEADTNWAFAVLL